MGWNVTERQEKDDLESLNSREENMEQVSSQGHFGRTSESFGFRQDFRTKSNSEYSREKNKQTNEIEST